MYAEHLRLRRYYFLDDDIESFYEYDHRLGHHIMKTSKHTTFKALNFMNIVLENSISNDEKLNDEFMDKVISVKQLLQQPKLSLVIHLLFQKYGLVH